MKGIDETWLLSSVAKAWKCARRDARKGRVWTEQDLVVSFHKSLRKRVSRRNKSSENGLGEMRLLTELLIRRGTREYQFLDIALVEVKLKRGKIPEPIRIIAQFEFKNSPDYEPRSKLEGRIRNDLRRLRDGNDEWTIWDTDMSAKTKYVFFGLVAINWAEHIRGTSPEPNNDGILHPNGTHRYSKSKKSIPKLTEHPEWLRYFELHGPVFQDPSSGDYIMKKSCHWSVLRVKRDGSRELINPAQ